jgi:hypothetical protein
MKKGASEFTDLPWHFMVPKAGFEPAQVSPPPLKQPQPYKKTVILLIID